MAELRKDPILERWVVFSTERAKRPSEFVVEKAEKKQEIRCPFCEGNEGMTPPEILSYRKDGSMPNTPGWWVRVVPNKYPALGIEGELNKRQRGIYDMMNGIGAHEVIIECPQHLEDIISLDQKNIEEIIWVYRDRMRDLAQDLRFEYALIFKNKGRIAGASLNHSHSQIIVTPVVPKRTEEELAGSNKYFTLKGKCVFCDIINQELDSKERILWDNEDFVSLCPFASRFPYEINILPRQHYSNFETITERGVKNLAVMLRKCLGSLDKTIPDVPYNYLIHTSPYTLANLDYYHWHLEIIPRLTRVAGFEWGTGFYINPVLPEEAAGYLREKEGKISG